MADLNISGATYGRDTAGAKALISNLKGDISTAQKALTGADYQKIITFVNQYWSGADATKFINEFKKTVQYISTQYGKINSLVDTMISADAKYFAGVQNANANSITGKNVLYK